MECENGKDTVKVPNIKLTMAPDVCLGALTPSKTALKSYTAKFKAGEMLG